jgi:hypothetical protein
MMTSSDRTANKRFEQSARTYGCHESERFLEIHAEGTNDGASKT